MAIICPKHNLLFLHCPQSGGTSISNALITRLGGVSILVAKETTNKKRMYEVSNLTSYYRTTIFGLDGYTYIGKHMDLRGLMGYGAITEAQRKNLTIFTTQRNPLDSFASQYQKIVNGEIYQTPLKKQAQQEYLDASYSFSYFLKKYFTLLKAQWVNGCRFACQADEILCFDSLGDDFKKMLKKLGIKPPSLPSDNKTFEKRPYQDYYTKDDLIFIKQADPQLLEDIQNTFGGFSKDAI